MKTIQELYNEITANDKLKEEYLKAYDEGSVAGFLSLHDCPASADELCVLFKMPKPEAAPVMLDDETLDEVSGGGSTGFINNSIGGKDYLLIENDEINNLILKTNTSFINNSAINSEPNPIDKADFNIKESTFIDNRIIYNKNNEIKYINETDFNKN